MVCWIANLSVQNFRFSNARDLKNLNWGSGPFALSYQCIFSKGLFVKNVINQGGWGDIPKYDFNKKDLISKSDDVGGGGGRRGQKSQKIDDVF